MEWFDRLLKPVLQEVWIAVSFLLPSCGEMRMLQRRDWLESWVGSESVCCVLH